MHMRAFPPASGHRASTGGVLFGAGLTEAECFTAARAARGLPGTWWVQRDEDDRSYVSLGLLADDGSRDAGVPTFLLWREDGSVRLACEHDGFYADFGTHPDLDAAMGAVRCALDAMADAAAAMAAACRLGEARPAVFGPRPLRDPDAATWRLAEWADAARRSGRSARADGLVRLAWEAFDRPKRTAG